MRRVAIAQLGSLNIDQNKFASIVALETVRQILPLVLNAVGLTAEASKCASVTTLEEARNAATNAAAYAATNAAAYAATNAAAYAAYAATNAATNAAYAAAYAANAATNAAYEILSLAAEIAVQALIECGAEGCAFLDLCEVSAVAS
jgi:PDZ domain-containing secreted protein